MTRIAILTGQNDQYQGLLESQGVAVSQQVAGSPIWLAEPGRAAALLRQGHPPPTWLASTYAGVDALMAEDLPRNYQLTNVRGIFGPLMAQYVFAHLLSHLRQLPLYVQQQARRLWLPHPYPSLEGQCLTLLGTGDIARQIARVGKSFGMTLHGVNRSGREVAGFDRVYPATELKTALAQSDVLVSILPSTPESRRLLNADTLAALPSHATLINVGRGSVLDPSALVAALNEGRLAHAVLDVFDEEPLPADSPLWQHPKITLTPHVAATSFPEQVVALFVQNLTRFKQGQSLLHRVDFERGY
ncbi:D-2-hydroxyacid dehydrogenase [Ferrimonas gelatinilytica]|uniref:D-2-hydroxyacid dehydrogenase n=1 Tax=Ferrimonas gelatinilytica TaxID=1255257 RepID=A0ABP9S572_9GAMM